jgi:hypothetical protein
MTMTRPRCLSAFLNPAAGFAIGTIMQSQAAAKGIDIEYRDSDHGATVYQYKTEDGKKILKEVVTRIKDGEKVFEQRRPGPTGYGYIYDVKGVPPSFYHVELLKNASIFCIAEGEKDADTVTNLGFGNGGERIVGITSGGSTSWKPEFAKHPVGKTIVLMPDDDDWEAVRTSRC